MKYKHLGNTKIKVPVIGQGTMGIGGYFTKDATRDDFYVRMLRKGIESGMTFIDTAEAYGQGHSEELVGKAIKNCRKKVFVATKVSPENLSYDSLIKAAEDSLRRLQTDYIDLYQIHWSNPAIPIEETLGAMERLIDDGKIRHAGVCNFSLDELKSANAIFKDKIVSNQVEYNLFDRTIEEDILPYCEKENITVIAYSPLDNGNFMNYGMLWMLEKIAKEYDKTASQIILNWLTSKSPVIAIPKATGDIHIEENASSMDFNLTHEDMEFINRTFWHPRNIIQMNLIKADKTGLDNLVPKAEDLAKNILSGATLKPVRVKKIQEPDYDYELVEGKVRYWARFIAMGANATIEALIR